MGVVQSGRVKEWAHEVGFDLVGIAPAVPMPEAERAALKWVRSGMSAGMSWITEERTRLSCDPTRLLPGARSVIVLGMYYLSAADPTACSGGEPRGRIARYAWGEDYHGLFPPMMKRLLDLVAGATGRRPVARLFGDSGPLAEKALAGRCGVGWYGKNGCVLTPGYGSWVLLAEIVTDLDLEPDPPLERDCGRCRLCIEGCPTGAIVAPHVVDSRRCISYLTIEHRGAIPLELRSSMGDRVFGCDLCQEVCPHNRLASPRADPVLGLGSDPSGRPALAPLLELDAEGFRMLFRRSPISRPKRRGFLRNVAVALGNARDPAAVGALARAMEDEEPLVRSHAAWALGEIGGRMARASLERALARECDEAVRREIRSALEK